MVNVGLANFTRTFTDPSLTGPAARDRGLELRVRDHHGRSSRSPPGCWWRSRSTRHASAALRFYRLLIVLPYAMPSFAMLLVWRDMFNADFGLINSLTGVHINWFGGVWTARFAILLIQFWLGYPYMFLVCLGALQSIPQDMTEAAAVDGARPYQAFRAVVFPLLLIAVAPLLIASFAFNFNNFNVDPAHDRRGAVPTRQPEGRWDGHPRQLRLPAGLRRRRRPVRLRRGGVGADLHHRGHRLDHRLPPDRSPRGDQPMTGQSWFGAVGWRHIVAILAMRLRAHPDPVRHVGRVQPGSGR